MPQKKDLDSFGAPVVDSARPQRPNLLGQHLITDINKKIFMMKFVFDVTIVFAIPAAFIMGQNYPNDRVVAILPYVILQLIIATTVSCAFWFLFLKKR